MNAPQNATEKKDGLFFNETQDARTAQSARMIAPYTDQEIETLYNQPKLEPNQNES